jgi:serine/threonine-protein kinase RsbW
MTTNQRAEAEGARAAAAARAASGAAAASEAAQDPSADCDTRAVRRMAALRFPADKDYLALARTTAMHIAGLLDLPLGRVTDLRLAVDEACTAFLTAGRATAADVLDLRYDLLPEALRVSVRGPVPARWPETVDELGWTMLRALVAEVRTEIDDGIGTLILMAELPAPSVRGVR